MGGVFWFWTGLGHQGFLFDQNGGTSVTLAALWTAVATIATRIDTFT